MRGPCVYVDLKGKWRTADCSDKRSSICMKSTGQTHIAFKNDQLHYYCGNANITLSLSFTDVPPTEPSDFIGFCPSYMDTDTRRGEYYSWLPFRGYCYLFLTERVEWPRASANCARHGKNFLLIV